MDSQTINIRSQAKPQKYDSYSLSRLGYTGNARKPALPFFGLVSHSNDFGHRYYNGTSSGLLSNVRDDVSLSRLGIKAPAFFEYNSKAELDSELIRLYQYWRQRLKDNGLAMGISRQERYALQKEVVEWLAVRNFSYVLPQGALIIDEYQPQDKLKATLMHAERYGGWSPSGGYFSMQHEDWYPAADRVGVMINMLNNAIMEDAEILTRYQAMPESFVPLFDLSTVAGTYLLSLALSFMLPSFVSAIVVDKQEKVIVMMRMAGLKIETYWFVTYVYNMVNYALAIGSLWLAAFLFQNRLFVQTDPWLMLFLFVLWGHVMISLSFVLSTLFNKVRTASIASYFLVILGVILSNMLNGTVWMNSNPPVWYFIIWPPFGFYRLIFLLSDGCINSLCLQFNSLITGQVDAGHGNSFNITSVEQAGTIVIILVAQTIIMFIAAWYINEVQKKDWGVSRPWYFPFEKLVKRRYVQLPDFDNDIEDGKLDADVRKEQQRSLVNDGSLTVQSLTKQYKGSEVQALKPFCLSLKKGEVFGLLGANGSAKTTLISCLTGLLEPTSGNAYYGDLSIRDQMVQIQQKIGLCMQFDVLYAKLTCLEHLLFFGRLKAIPKVRQHAIEILETVGLENDMNKLSSELSGGMKRRLSIAIAIVGNPEVLFLDEASAGVDPLTRRNIWAIFRQILDKRSSQGNPMTVLLTTHIIEEADELCDRVAVMQKGQLLCIGEPEYLKQKFSVGYTLKLNFGDSYGPKKGIDLMDVLVALFVPEDKSAQLSEFGFSSPEVRVSMQSHLGSNYTFRIETHEIRWSLCLGTLNDLVSLQTCINIHGESLVLKEWQIQGTSLEDVFVKLLS